MTNKEKVCEKNCPDFNGMSILHLEQCGCSCHPVLAKGEIPMTNTEKRLEEFDEKFPEIHGTNTIGTGEMRGYIKEFLTDSIQQAIVEDRARVVGLVKNNKDPYMLPATEERFLKDLSSLDINNKEND